MALERFLNYVDRASDDDCWIWQGPDAEKGYGRFRAGAALGGNHLAHRFSYLLFRGRLHWRETVDHLCRNRRCVNPKHLEAVSNRTNVLRGTGPSAVNATKTHCKHGHEFTPENTYIRATPSGVGRTCRKCAAAAQAAYKARHLASARE